MFDKQVTLTQNDGVWSAAFRTSQGQDPVTPAELSQIIRTLNVSYRAYLGEARRKFRATSQAAEKKQNAKQPAMAGNTQE